MTYTADNDLSSLTRYDSLTAVSANVVGTTVYSYDNADRVTAITTKNSTSTTLAYYDYAYDAANRVTVETTLSGGAETFSYDAASQLLTDHLNGSPTVTYSYDSNGNRTMSGYATGTGNEMTNDGTYTYTYDNVGNLTEQAAASGSTVMYYTYNQMNEVTSIRVTSNGTTNVSWTTFTYDALGRRVEQDTWQSGVGNTTTRMAFDLNGQVWADLDGSNALQTRYIMGVGLQQYLAREDGSGNVYWYVQDANYSVRDILNSSGSDVDTIAYTAYGNIVSQSGATYSGVILYAAYRYFAPANLDETPGRFYQPTDGNWIQFDPSGFTAGDPNLQRYVGNNPTNATDPSGLKSLTVALLFPEDRPGAEFPGYRPDQWIHIKLANRDDWTETQLTDFFTSLRDAWEILYKADDTLKSCLMQYDIIWQQHRNKQLFYMSQADEDYVASVWYDNYFAKNVFVNKQEKRAIESIWKWFGGEKESLYTKIQIVKKVTETIHKTLVYFRDHTIKFEVVPDLKSNAESSPYNPWRDTELSTRFVKYFSIRDQTWTLLHEFTHLAVDTDDHGYIFPEHLRTDSESFYHKDNAKVSLSWKELIDNADTYAGFLMQFYHKTGMDDTI